MKIYDVIIAGSGPAGMTAAIYAKRANLDVLLLDKLAPGGQINNTYEIQNYPGFASVNGADLAMQVFEHTQALGIEFDYATVEKNRDRGLRRRRRYRKDIDMRGRKIVPGFGCNSGYRDETAHASCAERTGFCGEIHQLVRHL